MTAPAAGDAPTASRAVGSRRILFTTSNGTGLGHLTRSMAIARRLGPDVEPLFLTLSGAAPVVRRMGFPVEYVPSYGTPGSGNDYRWSRRLRGRLRGVIAEAEPAAVVFDGTHPYEALLGALPREGVSVWCRRALWRRGSSRVPLGREGAFDAVLEPGELAAEEDRGPTVTRRERARRVGPIVLLDRDELLPRAEAERELGLEPGATTVLVTLGQGAEVRAATEHCLRALAGRDGIQVAALSSALAGLGEPPAGVVHLQSTYPMSRYFAAFDAAIAAAGYNAFHELVALGVPSLFVPMPRETDDQPARARWAEAAGAGLAAEGPVDPRLEELVDRLCDPDARAEIAARLAQLPPASGAAEAATWLTDLVGAPDSAPNDAERQMTAEYGTKSATRPGGRASTGGAPAPHGSFRGFRRRWGTFLASAPRTAVRLARQQLTQPRPRTAILAVGRPEGETAEAVRAALDQTPDPPERTLVITDALGELPALRALGVGIEHVPASGEHQAELAGGDYDDFLRRRIELILAERPRPRRTLTAAGGIPWPSPPAR